MNQPFFNRLLQQYITGELSAEDKVRLGEMIHQPEYAEILESFVREIMLSDEFSHIESPAVKSGILAHLDEAIGAEEGAVAVPDNRPHFRLGSVGRYAASVVLLILLSGMGYFIWQRRHNDVLPAQVQHDAAPGHDGAILTLAGGKQIVLDSAVNGTLALQGMTAVVKTKGQISYRGQPADKAVLYNTMSTPRGRQFQLVLADGTHVYLNAASSITFPTAFTGNKRSVSITGEVYFDVVHNPSAPFTITVNGTEVEVLGTQLNINAYDDEERIKTTLVEGKVKASENAAALLLNPGEQAQTGRLLVPKIIKNVPVDEVLAWKNGFFQFNGASIQSVMRQLSRWYDVKVSYQGLVPDHRFVGRVGRDYNLSEVLAVLSASDVHFSIEGKKIIVKP
jgi:transmembrane sensor